MADPAETGATEEAPAAPAKSRIGIETLLGVAGAVVLVGFFLPWMELPGGHERVSGLDIARTGGMWAGLAAIPALGLITAILGGLRWNLSRYSGLLTAIAMIVPAAYLLASHMHYLYWAPIVLGVALIVLGKLSRGLVITAPLGGILLVGSALVPLLDKPLVDSATKDPVAETTNANGSDKKGEDKNGGDKKGEDKNGGDKKGEDKNGGDGKSAPNEGSAGPLDTTPALTVSFGLRALEGLGVVLPVPLAALALLMPICGIWLLFTGLRKKNQPRALVFTGWSIIALDAYVAALKTFGAILLSGGVGLWMTLVAGVVLLLVSAPLRTRRKRKQAPAERGADPGESSGKADEKVAAKKDGAKKDEDKQSAAKAKAKQKAAAKAKAKEKAAAKAKAKQKADDDAAADQAAAAPKVLSEDPGAKAAAQQAQKLAKLKELKARKLAAAKAKREEAELAQRGEALASDPEPQFAADPTAPAAPDDEDREALMKRMGVKKPPPLTENQLEDMLAALKQRAGEGDD